MKNQTLIFFLTSLLSVSILFLASCGGDGNDPISNDTTPVITTINPLTGPVGTEVIITGKNFSTTPASNKVKFNTTDATVTGASETELTVLVPTGATTGNVTVEVDSKSATSAQVFTVTVADLTPTITSFTPASGVIGTTVTITGTKFSTTLASNEVKINGISTVVTTASATQLKVTVPGGATTGKISVKVNGLTAVSATDFTVTVPAVTQWEAKTNLTGTARSHGVGFAVSGKGYIGLGINFITPLQDFWQYDATAGTWTQKANYGGGKRYKAAAFVVGDKAYVATGINESGSEMKDLWVYDPALNTWTQKADYGGTMTYGAFAFTLNGLGYVGDGGQMFAYDPAGNTWTTKKAYEGSGDIHTSYFAIGDKGYVGNGYAPITGEQSDFWEYNPTTNDWTQKTNVPGNDRGEAIGFSINNKGYIGLGSNKEIDFYEFDPSNNTWTPKNNFPKAGGLYGASAFTIGSKAYVGTGNDTNVNASKSFYEFDPSK